MARLNATNFSGALQFPYATAGTDLFKKEDVQTMALAVDQHDHANGKGLPVTRAGVLSFGTGTTPPLIQPRNSTANPVGQYGLSVESSIESVFVSGRTTVELLSNAYWDGSAYQRWDTGLHSGRVTMANGALSIYHVVPGSGPITWGAAPWVVDGDGNMYFRNGVNLLWVDANNAISNLNNNTYFDNKGGSWWWRTTPAYTMAMNLSAVGNLQVAQDVYAVNFRANAGGAYVYGTAGPATQNFVAFGGNGSLANAQASTVIFRRNYDNVNVVTVTGGGDINMTGQLYLGQIVQFAGTSMIYGDGNSLQFRMNTGAGGSAQFMNGTATGWANTNAAGFIVQPSMRAAKDNIHELADALALVQDDRLHGVSYVLKDDGTPQIGFIADEWAETLPEAVAFNEQNVPAGLNYGALGAVTFEALKQYVQQTNARIAALESRLEQAA